MFFFNFFKKNKNNPEKRIPPTFPSDNNIKENKTTDNKKKDKPKIIEKTNIRSLKNEPKNEDSSVIDDSDEYDEEDEDDNEDDEDDNDDKKSDGGKVKFGLG